MVSRSGNATATPIPTSDHGKSRRSRRFCGPSILLNLSALAQLHRPFCLQTRADVQTETVLGACSIFFFRYLAFIEEFQYSGGVRGRARTRTHVLVASVLQGSQSSPAPCSGPKYVTGGLS